MTDLHTSATTYTEPGWYWARRHEDPRVKHVHKWRPVYISAVGDGSLWVWNEGPLSELLETHELGKRLSEQEP